MVQHKQAFTLIELLVVVLIIGILAAVAVPQYQVAVLKSRVASTFHLLKAIDVAQEEYRLANGSYASDFVSLTIDLPTNGSLCSTKKGLDNYPCADDGSSYCFLWGNGSSIECGVKGNPILIEKFFNRNYSICWPQGNDLADKVCRTLGEKGTGASGTYYKIL